MIFLTSKRLVLRSLCTEDVDVMYDYRNNILCSKYQRGQLRKREDIALLVLRRKGEVLFETQRQLFAIEERESGEMVGEIALYFGEGTVTLGYTVSHLHHRRGFAYEMLSLLLSELFLRFPDITVICRVVEGNEASKGLLLKLGFTALGYDPSVDALTFKKRKDTRDTYDTQG